MAALTLIALLGCGRSPGESPALEQEKLQEEPQKEESTRAEPTNQKALEDDTSHEAAAPNEQEAENDEAETESADGEGEADAEESSRISCALSGPVLAFSEGLGTAAISAKRRNYLIAGYALHNGRSLLRVYRGRVDEMKKLPRLLHERTLKEEVELARPHPPAIAWIGEDGFIAYLDEAGRLYLMRVKDGRSVLIEEQLDPRFSPALKSHGDDLLLAYSKSLEGVSRLFLLRLDRELKTHGALDLTPVSQSASAPSFIEGSERPLLLGVDARLGFSPALLWDLEGAEEPRVVRPISHLVEPAFLRGAMSGGALHIVYIARGIDLAHAVGWFREGEGAPEPASVVPPLGFGLLRADLAPIDAERLLIVADRPLERAQNAPRELVLRTLERDALSEPEAIRGSDGSAARPSLSALGDGRFALVYGTRAGQELAFIACQ